MIEDAMRRAPDGISLEILSDGADSSVSYTRAFLEGSSCIRHVALAPQSRRRPLSPLFNLITSAF